MNAAIRRPATPTVDNSPPLNSRGVLVLTGLSYLFVGLGFSYLDRGYGHFGLESSLWLVWVVLGFGAGAVHAHKAPGQGGQVQWAVMGAMGALLAVFPGFVMFSLLRWACLFIMVVMGARAAILRTRRDFYFTLTVIFVVSLMVGTHGNADWTLWIYLGPAWAFGGLALAWEYAAGTALSRWTKLFMTLGFLGLSLALTALLFLFLPRPTNLGFGFLPPGTDTPGLFTTPAGGGNQDGRAAGGNGGSGTNNASGTPQPGSNPNPWRGMLQGMQEALRDKNIPDWQRNALKKILGAGEWMLDQGQVRGDGARGPKNTTQNPTTQSERWELTAAAVIDWLRTWLLWLALLLIAYLLWRRRYRIGLGVTLGLARLLARAHPLRSMQLSAVSLRWCLHVHGHARQPGQSIREYWSTAAHIAPLAKRWLGRAVEDYCAVRFGGIAASAARALRMQESVHGACDIVMGRMPELSQ